jgi:uncharacterized phage protein (TIGR01671 family)
MSRPIKFRAWHTTKKQWIYPLTFAPHTNGTVYMDGIDQSDCELSQFTGLLDRSGAEIYEDDIIKFQMTRTTLVDHPVMIATEDQTAIYQGAVMWGEFGWRPFVDGKTSNIEVIGNRFEHPELLK